MRPGRCAYPGKDTAERPPTAANGIPGRDAACGGFYFNRQPFSSSILPGTSASFIRRIRATSCMESISQPHRAQIDRLYAFRFVKAVEAPEPGRPYELRLVIALEQQPHPVLPPEIEVVRITDGLPFDLPAYREHLGNAVFGKYDIRPAVVQRADTVQQGKTRRRHETPSQNDIADTVQDKAAGDPGKESRDGDTHRLLPGFMHYHLHPQPDFSFRDRANSSPKA